MSNYKRITKQTGVSYFFSILTFISAILLIPLLTRTLSVNDFGVYSILSSTIAVLGTILYLGLPYFIITKMTCFESNKRVKYLASILAYLIPIMALFFLFLQIPAVRDICLSLLKLHGFKSELYLAAAVVVLSVFSSILSSYLSAKREIEHSSAVSFLVSSSWIILIGIFYLFFKQMNVRFIMLLWLFGMLFAIAVNLFLIRADIMFFFSKVKHTSRRLFSEALLFSLPFIPLLISNFVVSFADRYLINYYLNTEAVAIYSLSYSLVFIILSFASILSVVFYPHIAKAWGERKNHQILFNILLKYTLILIVPATVGFFILRNAIITLVSGVQYLPSSSTTAILILFPLIASLTNIYINNLILQGKTLFLAGIFSIGAIINIVLNILFIPLYGINGSAIASVISYALIFVAVAYASRGQLLWNFEFLKIGKIVAASLLMGIIVYSMNPQVFVMKLITVALGSAAYCLFLLFFHVFEKKEIQLFWSFVRGWKK